MSALFYALSLALLGLALTGADGNASTLRGEQVRAPETYARVFTYPASVFLLLGILALGAAMYFLVHCQPGSKHSKSRRNTGAQRYGA